MIVLGIDPGSRRVGFGAIRIERGAPYFLDAGLLSLSPKLNGWETLLSLKKSIDCLIRRLHPSIVGIETLSFVKNKKTGIAVAHTRGILLLSALEHGVRIYECAPTEVKAGVTGYGGADKASVAKMVFLLLKKPRLPLVDDAVDALAVALVAANHAQRKP